MREEQPPATTGWGVRGERQDKSGDVKLDKCLNI